MKRDTLVFVLLLIATSSLALLMATRGGSSWLEAVSFVTGAICVWLTVKENVWNFPIGLLNVITFCVVFFRANLFADAGLQIVYFILGLIGWYQWLYGGEKHTALKVSRVGKKEGAIILIAVAALTVLLWHLLREFGGSASFWDALTTAISLGAQWLLNRKFVESWVGWIVVDAIYVPLYLYKDLHLTAILYAIFLTMACIGLRSWLQTLKMQQNSERSPELASVT